MSNRRRLFAGFLLLGAAALYIFIPRPALLDGVSFSQAVYDRDGRLLRLTLSVDEKYRLYTHVASISPQLVEAALIHEDKFFFLHPGVNPVALAKGAWQTFVAGGRRVGASTITMQVARMRYGINSRTIAGKLYQIIKAVQIERHYTKQQILEAYLNLLPYGRNIEGAGAASLIYFKKPANQLTVHEALTLAIIPQSPALRAPLDETDLSNAELMDARSALYEKWILAHPEDSSNAEMLKLPMTVRPPSELPFLAPHLVDSVLRKVRSRGRIATTVDMGLQMLVERKLKGYVERKKRLGINNASAMLVDFRTMDVLAVVGSADFFDDRIFGQVNGTLAKRSPGSALKPFIYALGIDAGIIHPMTMLKDSPSSYGGYNPENFDNEFVGPLKAVDALIRSRNVPAVDVASRLPAPGLYGFMKAAGVEGMKDERHYGLALVLGGAEVTMEELVRMYAMLANNGVIRPLRVFIDEPPSEETRLLSEQAAFLVLEMLKTAPRPDQNFSEEWVSANLPVSWKTGTSYAFRDAWSISVFGPYVLAVWVGNFDGEGNQAFIGKSAAAPLMFEIIDAIKSAKPASVRFYTPIPQGVSKVRVCEVSGQIPSAHCPRTIETWFVPGKSPIKTCDIHREILINEKSGLRACNYDEQTVKKAVYEFWPSDLQRIFRAAGLPRRPPPPYMPGCGLQTKAASGNPPRITSPMTGVTYNIRVSKGKAQVIPLLAVTDADTTDVYWFADEKYLGISGKGKEFMWAPAPGKYVVRVVDDHGRPDSREVTVELAK